MGIISKTPLSTPNHSRAQEVSPHRSKSLGKPQGSPMQHHQGSIPCISLCSVSQARLRMCDIITKPRGQKEMSPNHGVCME